MFFLRRLYPIGIQTFEKIRNGNYLYIDKTEYVYRMAHSDSNYIFLSRPRRFGKSLLTSTLEAYFEGRRELFRGLALERLETEWTEYPVLRFDMSTAKHVDKERLESELNLKLIEYENVYGRGEGEENVNQRFQGIIAEPTNRQAAKWWCSSTNTMRPCSTWCMKKRTCPSSAILCVISIVPLKPATLTCASCS